MVEKKAASTVAKKATHTKKQTAHSPKAPDAATATIHVYDLKGAVDHSVEPPAVFRTNFRPDLIRRAVTASRANRRQAYGPGARSGMRHSVRWSGKGQGVSRVPRIRGTMIGAQAPGTRGGRRAHPPTPRTIWAKKMNAKEKMMARNSALVAISNPEQVRGRGHYFNPKMTLPLVIVDKIEETNKTKDAIEILTSLGLIEDVERARNHMIMRAGRGKMRGRRYRASKSLLLVVSDTSQVSKGFANLPGVEFTTPAGLNAESLAPGGEPGRLTVFSETAFEKLRGW